MFDLSVARSFIDEYVAIFLLLTYCIITLGHSLAFHLIKSAQIPLFMISYSSLMFLILGQ